MALYVHEQIPHVKSQYAICPVCGKCNCTTLYTLNSVQSANSACGAKIVSDKTQYMGKAIEELWHSDRCTFVRCESCQFCFSIPYLQASAALYEQAYSSNKSYCSWKWEYQITYKEMLKEFGRNSNATMLEIGAGNGSFVKKVAPYIFEKRNVLCSEYSLTGAEEIREYGIECITEDILHNIIFKENHKYDIICMFQVLEHMEDINSVFNAINEITHARSHLFIGLPNDRGREYYDSVGVIEDVPPWHVARYSIISMHIIAQKNNWKIVKHVRQPDKYYSKLKKYIYYSIDRYCVYNNIVLSAYSIVRKLQMIYYVFKCVTMSKIIDLIDKNVGTVQWVHMIRSAE